MKDVKIGGVTDLTFMFDVLKKHAKVERRRAYLKEHGNTKRTVEEINKTEPKEKSK